MYVKALLKIFEYATDIRQNKLLTITTTTATQAATPTPNSATVASSTGGTSTPTAEDYISSDCNEDAENDPFGISDAKTPDERKKQIALMRRLRDESFRLHSQKSDEIETLTPQDDPDAGYHDEDDDDQTGNIGGDLTNDKDSNDNFKLKKITTTLKQRSKSKSNENLDTMVDNFKSKIGICKIGNKISHDCLVDPKHNRHSSSSSLSEHQQHNKQFHMGDIIGFVNKGIDSIVDDAVTKRFTTEELRSWNLLTRTNQQYEYISFRVTVLWLLGFILRYFILFPFRMILFVFACFYTMITTSLIGHVPDSKFKRYLNHRMSMILHRILSRVFSAIITFHDRDNKAKYGSICVANHTSPIDVIILSTDNTYSFIGQQHGGYTGIMQRAFSRAARHIWFDRSESKDRLLVSKRMSEHVKNDKNCPLLIFPEGTCINNTSVMMFKKGCFEIDDCTIFPVAIKYDSRFGDAFWNSGKHSMLQYLILMMTSWAIVVDVYYLPPMKRYPDESVLEFTSRVKSAIAARGGFANLDWDGMLKRSTPKLDLLYKQQLDYTETIYDKNNSRHQKDD